MSAMVDPEPGRPVQLPAENNYLRGSRRGGRQGEGAGRVLHFVNCEEDPQRR